jgi:hypothetical protein
MCGCARRNQMRANKDKIYVCVSDLKGAKVLDDAGQRGVPSQRHCHIRDGLGEAWCARLFSQHCNTTLHNK